MLNGQCVSNCPATYYVMNNTCQPCTHNCQTCTNATSCTVCISGYFLDIITLLCVSDCNMLSTSVMSFYPTNTTCQPCSNFDVNCVVCGYSTTNTSIHCLVCQSGSYLYQGNCVTTCPSAYYNSTNPNVCVPCTAPCINCTSAACSGCSSGWVLSSTGTCINSCPQGQEIVTSFGVSSCQPCATNCQACSNGTCTVCQQPYLLLGNGSCMGCVNGYYYDYNQSICSQCSNECASCSMISTNCTQCTVGYSLYQGNTCVLTCPSGFYSNAGVCTACTTPSCASCPANQCQSCVSGFVIVITNGTVSCANSCPVMTFLDSVTNICHSCGNNCNVCTSATSCTTCNNVTNLYLGYCLTTCPSGYAPVGGICTPCLTGCKTCPTLNNCSSCNSGLVNDGNGTCSPNTNPTVNCSTGYYPNTLGNCSQCYPTCHTCSGGQVTDCLTCFNGSNLINGVCIAACTSGYFYNQNTTSCELCSTQYTNCLTCTSSGCTACTTNYSLIAGVCDLSCPNGTYLASQQCLACSTFCNVCQSSSICTECLVVTPPVMLYNGGCHINCPQLTYQVNGTCAPCDPACLLCSGSASNCSSCLTPYSLSGNTCVVSCPNGTYSDGNYTCLNCSINCLICSGATTCSSCVSPFILQNGTCRSSCANGYYLDVAASRCIACVFPCVQCASRTNCTACDVNYTLNGSVCTGSCIEGQYFNASIGVNGTCTPCSIPGCGICTSTTCQSCATGKYAYYVNNVLSSCTDNCSYQSTYADTTTMTCEHCFTNCLICTNATYCNRCNNTYYLMGTAGTGFNECVNICPIGYFPFIDSNNIFPPACLPCSSNCNSCLNTTYCSTCASHYYRFTTQNPNTATNVTCVQNCPTGYATPTIINGAGMCSLCGAFCAVCTDSVTCVQCISNTYVILNGVCTPFNCLNCVNCTETANTCHQCVSGYYLFNSGCSTTCPNGYYPDSNLGICAQCMANCDICFNATVCAQCITSYIFYTATGTCENQGFV